MKSYLVDLFFFFYCSSERYYTAEYLDYYVNPLSVKHDSYIKDTYDFVEKIKQLHVPLNSFFFMMDVDSLYTNIDIAEGIQTIKTFSSDILTTKDQTKSSYSC